MDQKLRFRNWGRVPRGKLARQINGQSHESYHGRLMRLLAEAHQRAATGLRVMLQARMREQMAKIKSEAVHPMSCLCGHVAWVTSPVDARWEVCPRCAMGGAVPPLKRVRLG